MSTLAIVEAFSELPDPRRGAGCRHQYAVCLALFTLAISAGCRGFLAMGDWLKAYRTPLIELFGFPRHGIPSYSTIRRTVLELDYQTYGDGVANFFQVEPKSGETVGLDGKVLRGSYTVETGSNQTDSHPAIQLVTVYVVERGLILPPQQVDCKTNEIKAIPPVLAALAQRGVVFAFDALNTQKETCEQIIESGNDYLGALKGNHSKFHAEIQEKFQSESHLHTVETCHGRVERRSVSLWTDWEGELSESKEWVGLRSIIRVTSYRHLLKGEYIHIRKPETRYYISSLDETVEQFADRIRNYWGIENKVHYVRDVTQGEDASRIRVGDLPAIFAIARNLALNLYRDAGERNMAQAQRLASHGLDTLKKLFRMK